MTEDIPETCQEVYYLGGIVPLFLHWQKEAFLPKSLPTSCDTRKSSNTYCRFSVRAERGRPWRREGKTLKDAQEETGAGAEEWGCTQLRARPVVTKWALPGKHDPPALTNKRFQQTPTEDLTRLSTADICSNMDEPWDHHTEWSQSDRGGIVYDIPYMQDQKRNYTNEPIYKTQKRLTVLKNKLMVDGEKE